MGKKILFLSQYFWPEEMATAEMLSGIAISLSKTGFNVKAIAGQPAYHDMKSLLKKKMYHNDVEIDRIWSTQYSKNTKFGRIFNTLTFSLSAILKCIKQPKNNIIIAVTNPPLLLWVAWIVNILRGIPYILVIHDVYPDVAVALNYINKNSLVNKVWKYLNMLSYNRSNKIVVLGECMAEVLRSNMSVSKKTNVDKVVVIPNWSDDKVIDINKEKDNELLKTYRLEDKFIVQYSGNIGMFHDMRTIMDAAYLLKDDENIHFMIIGEGVQLSWMKDIVKAKSINNITFIPFQPKEILPKYLNLCDVALLSLKDEVTGLCVPSKLYGILSSGKPVVCIANNKSESAIVVNKYNCGIVIAPGDVKGLASVISDLRNNTDKCKRYAVMSRKAYENEFTLKKVNSLYSEILSDIK